MDTITSRKLTLLSFTCLWWLSGVWTMLQMPQTRVDVIRGERVVLKAWYTPVPGSDLSKTPVLWSYVQTNSTKLVISYSTNSINVGDSHHHGRVGFTSGMPSANLSLYINSTREADSGRYVCQVLIPGTPGFTLDLRLDVKVPPSVPECSLSGKPVLKGNVTLNCGSNSGRPVPLYLWQKTSPTQEVFFMPMLNDKAGTLKLSNLSSSMSGKYKCTSTNSAGSESCFINLEIISSTNAGVIAGATVGAVVGFLIILFFLIFLLRRRRETEDDMANDIKEDAQAPKRVSWAKSGMGSDIISKNGTMSSIGSGPHHHKDPSNHHLHQYPQRPASDTASIITAAGSTTAGYRPPRQHGASTPTHYGGYDNSSTLPRGGGQPPSSRGSSNGSPLPRTERSTPLPLAHPAPQGYSQPPLTQSVPRPPPMPMPTSVVTASNISRMGGVPIMVPAQNQAGSLV